MGEWLQKLWYLEIMEAHSAIKRNGLLLQAISWVNFKEIMSNESKSQSQRDINHMIPLLGYRNNIITEMGNGLEFARVRRESRHDHDMTVTWWSLVVRFQSCVLFVVVAMQSCI